MSADAESPTIEPLIADLLAWIAKEERTYAEVMDAWRTSCPRLPVWEEANARGLVARNLRDGIAIVTITAKGLSYIERRAVTA